MGDSSSSSSITTLTEKVHMHMDFVLFFIGITIISGLIGSCWYAGAYDSCEAALQGEVNVYRKYVFLTLGVTLICSIVGYVKTDYFHENPDVGALLFYAFSILTVYLGIILVAMFPGCPPICGNTCVSAEGHHYIYHGGVFVVSILWFHLGNIYCNLAKVQASASVVGNAEEIDMMKAVRGPKELV